MRSSANQIRSDRTTAAGHVAGAAVGPALLAALLLCGSGAAAKPSSKGGKPPTPSANPATVKMPAAGAAVLDSQLRPLPMVLRLGDLGRRLSETWQATPVFATGGGSNHSEVGMNLFHELSFGYLVGPGHQGEGMGSGGKVRLGDFNQGDRSAVSKALIAERDQRGAKITAPSPGGTFHTHPGDRMLSFSGQDLEVILRYSTSVTALHVLQGTGMKVKGVLAVLVVPGAAPKAFRDGSLPDSLTPEQIAYLLDRAAPGRTAVYAGAGLSQDLKRVSPGAAGLKGATLKKIDALALGPTVQK